MINLKIGLEDWTLRDPNGVFFKVPTLPDFDFALDETALADANSAQALLEKVIVLPNGKRIVIKIGEALVKIASTQNFQSMFAGQKKTGGYFTQIEYVDSSKGDPVSVAHEGEVAPLIDWEVGGCIKVSGSS